MTIALIEAVIAACERANAAGIRIAARHFGVIDSYDSTFALTLRAHPNVGTICPIAVLALEKPPVPKKRNSKARNADRIEPVIACVLDLPVDYVSGLAQAFDGFPKWVGMSYGEDFDEGYRDGLEVAERLPGFMRAGHV